MQMQAPLPGRCPVCEGELLDDELRAWPYRDRIQRCANCAYWEEWTVQEDGTLIAVGHVPNQPESPESCEGER